MATAEVRHTLNEQQARQLSTVTKTVPMMEAITPRWLITFLSWVPVEAGVYRLNKVKAHSSRNAHHRMQSRTKKSILPEIYVDYDEKPREYTLNAVTSVFDVQTRISDLYRSPHDQIREQLRLMIEKVKERQEMRAHQQHRIWTAQQCRAGDESESAQRHSHARRHGRTRLRRSGRSQVSSWPIRAPLLLSDANARAAAFLRRPSPCLVRRS